MSLTIRHLASGDEAILEHLAVDVFDEAINHTYLKAYLAVVNHHMIVAINNGVVVGQIRAVIHKHPDKANELYIDNLGVTPSLQRQGIATQLLDAMLELGKRLGCNEAWLATEADNMQAKNFYESYPVTSEAAIAYFFKI